MCEQQKSCQSDLHSGLLGWRHEDAHCGRGERHGHDGHHAGPHGGCCDEHSEGDQSCGCSDEAASAGPGRLFQRRCATYKERLSRLEAYLEALHNEAKGVEERISEIRAKQAGPAEQSRD